MVAGTSLLKTEYFIVKKYCLILVHILADHTLLSSELLLYNDD